MTVADVIVSIFNCYLPVWFFSFSDLKNELGAVFIETLAPVQNAIKHHKKKTEMQFLYESLKISNVDTYLLIYKTRNRLHNIRKRKKPSLLFKTISRSL